MSASVFEYEEYIKLKKICIYFNSQLYKLNLLMLFFLIKMFIGSSVICRFGIYSVSFISLKTSTHYLS